jgi:hypothetical protein
MFKNLPKLNEPMQFQSGDGKRRFFEALPRSSPVKKPPTLAQNSNF